MTYRIGLIVLTVLQITGLTAGLCGDDPCTGCGGTTTSCCPTTVDGFNPGLTTADYPTWIQTLQGNEAGIPPNTATLCVAYRTDDDATYGDSLCLLCRGPDAATRLQGQCCGFPLSTDTLAAGEYLITADGSLAPGDTQMTYYLAPYNSGAGGYTAATGGNTDQFISNQCTGTVDPANPNQLQSPTHPGFVLKDWCSDNIQETLDAGSWTVNTNPYVGVLYVHIVE